MKIVNQYRYWLLTLLALLSVGTWAQQRNVLSIPDAKVSIGQAQLPVAIENTDEIIAAQFDLTLPSTISAGTEATVTNRCDGHTVIIRKMEATRYRVMLYSDENRALIAQQGTVLYIPLNIPQTVAEGSELPLVISNATLTVTGGANVLTGTKAGKLIVSTLPDLTVKSIAANSKTITPSERLSLSWQVQNVGGAETGGGWSEQILLVNKRGTVTKLIGTVYQQETLAAGAVMSRQADIIVPQLLGIEGEAYVQVHIIANSDTGESALATGNNTAQGDETFTVSKRLFVEPSPATVTENYSRNIAVKVSRSGDWSGEQTFTLSTPEDSRATLPTQVTIPAGQSGAYVYMTVTDNDVLDDNSIVTITASGNNYPDGTGQLVIEDNEYPNLTLTASKSEITEGETFQLTVTTSRVSAQPIEVTLTSENTKRFSFPQTVTIPAGETSATVEVTAIDDELPSLVLSNAFTVSAPKHNKAEVIVLLKDNDLPVLELTLTPTTVQESAGVVAVAGVLKRTTNTNSKITVKLTDNANGGLYFGNRTLVLDKGVEEVHFNFGPVDNAIVDGDRTYTVTAAVWLSSCSCGASGESAGYVEAQLRVLDNDGPALNVTSSLSTVKEGGKTTLTVSRNTTDTSKALTVTINSDYEEELTYAHTVTIPAGQQSVTVEVTSAANSVQGDSHTVIFTVEAEGYASGTCYLMVTDQTLPDARISSITADVTEAEVGTKVRLTIEVTNEGAAELPAEVSVKIFCRGESTAVGTVYTNEKIAVGAFTTITKTITLPMTVGNHQYYAVVNESNKVQELSYNNTSQDVTVKAVAPFSVTVSTDKAIYKQGEKIVISGQLTGNGTANTAVDLYVINEGTRQVQSVTTDAQGAYSYEWQLYALQSGHFTVGACYPGEGLTTEMAAFDVYGLRRTSSGYITCDVISGDTHSGTLGVANPGNLDLTGVSVELLSTPSNCEATLNIPSIISGGTTAQLSYSLKALAPSTENKWGEVKARVSTQQGVSLDVTLYFYSRSAKGKLVASTQNIVTTMTKGKSREYSVQVTNTGRGNTGKITLALPDFIKSLSGNTLPALEQNDTINIPLSITPTEEMPLNIPVTGQLGINCENGEGVSVSFSITPVSEEKGTLYVDVCDENTYYTSEAPHVENAEVVVRNYTSNTLVSQGRTDSDGVFAVVLPEGYYKLSVTADNHDSYSNTIYVEPGVVKKETINLSIEAIKVSWKVEETEVEDEYEIVTTVTYETNVPTPVVELVVPNRIYGENLKAGESLIAYASLTNKGLITALNTSVKIPSQTGDFVWEPLSQNEGLEIAPGQSVYVPFKVTRVSSVSKSRRRASSSNDGCYTKFATAYVWKCGSDFKWHRYEVPIQYQVCPSKPSKPVDQDPDPDPDPNHDPEPTPPVPNPIGPGPGPGPDPEPYGPIVITPENPTTSIEHCIPCLNHYGRKLVDCVTGFIPIYGCIKGGYDCGSDFIENKSGWRRNTNCVLTVVGCAADKCSDVAAGTIVGLPVAGVCRVVGWITNIGQCIVGFTEPCNPDEAPTLARKRASSSSSEPSYVTTMRQASGVALKELNGFTDVLLEYFGDSVWVKNTTVEEQIELLSELAVSTKEYFSVNDLSAVKPEGVTESQFAFFVERLNNSTRYEQTGEDNTNRIHQEIINLAWSKVAEAEAEAEETGYADVNEMFRDVATTCYQNVVEQSGSVCASITLQFNQKMVMSRQAFRGTLSVFNGNEDTAMEDVRLNLEVTNTLIGQVATSHEFQINAESLDGFTGQLDLGSGWTLAANATGTATVLFIPTKYAAPTEPVEWSFGGTLTYIDPFTGLEVTRELYPVTLTVKPSPELDLTYFMQRDIYGDDPLTPDVVEPMKPAEFALLINNKGYGDATNVRMVTQQPEITDNEKGLLIDFELVSSQVNGSDAALSFGQSIANNFGTIPAHSQLYAQWWLTSTLLGHFTDYKVEATHVTSYGNEDLSLLDQVTIHELIHSVEIGSGDDKLRGFMVNDVADANDLPDMLYLTNGETQSVAIASTSNVKKQSATEYLLTVTPSETGWNYGSLYDPSHGLSEIKSIVRQSDGKEIALQNFWQTDRTLRDGKDWLYENRLHFADDFTSGAAETYLLTFEPVPEVLLQVVSIEGIPADGKIAEEPVNEVTVNFSKLVDPATFSTEDLTLAVQGVKQDVSQIGITTTDNKTFGLNLSELNEQLGNGYYVLTVQTADITDTEGFHGKDGLHRGWTFFRGGLVQLLTSAWPENSGTISRRTEEANARMHRSAEEDGTAKYGSTITFLATPEEGYEFSNWTLNGEVVGNEPEYTTTALGDMNVVANFKKKSYLVEIATDAEGGTISGAGTGIYDYGTQLSLLAEPNVGYELLEWLVNDKTVDDTDRTLMLTVDGAKTVEAVFEPEPEMLMGDVNGDGRITTYDVTMVVGYILNGQSNGLNRKAADMNGDGNITTFDAIQIVQLILSK